MGPRQVVAAIAAAELATSAAAMGKCLKSAPTVVKALHDTQWDLFDGPRHKGVGEAVLSALRDALAADEYVTALRPKLEEFDEASGEAAGPAAPATGQARAARPSGENQPRGARPRTDEDPRGAGG